MDIITVDTTDRRRPTPPALPWDLTGPVWVQARPALRRLHVLAGDILAALGKRRDISGKGRNEHEDIHHAEAWLHAHQVTDLVIDHSQRLPPKLLTGLCTLVESAGTDRLWLLHAPPRTDAVAHALTRHATRMADLDAVPTPKVHEPAATARPQADPLPAVPRVEFTTFWDACQRQLEPTGLALVGNRLAQRVHTFTADLTATGGNGDTVADLIFGLLNEAPTDDELAVDIRALQIAGWERDLYIKVDHTRLHQHEERPHLSQSIIDATMLAYRQPYRALTAALTRHGHGVADLTTITLDATDPATGTVHCRNKTITLTEPVTTALRAQHYLRRNHGSAGGDALLPHTPKALAKALTDAQTDLGVHVHGRRAERTRNHTTRELRQLGITLHDLS